MRNADMLDDVVLYDIMYEAGTRLGGMILELRRIAKRNGQMEEAERLLDERKMLQTERAAIKPYDRQSMIQAYDAWNQRNKDLQALIRIKRGTE